MFEFFKELLNQVFGSAEKVSQNRDENVTKPNPVVTPTNPINKEYAKQIGTSEWYAVTYDNAKTLPEWAAQAREACHKILSKRDRYSYVQAFTGVPWQVVALIHYRESSFNWNSCLHNGDPLGKKTVRVPAGRGPFTTWEDAAIDALIYDNAKKVKEWTLESSLDFMERYNGLGYRSKGLMSCYLWSCCTNMRSRGRYTYDGIYNPLATTKDYLGVVPILKEIESISEEYKLKRKHEV